MSKQKDLDASLAWEVASTEPVIKDDWIDFRKVAYRLPDGSKLGPIYQYSARSYVVVVAEDEAGHYLCVRQFRYGIGQITVEFPAGAIERKDGKLYGDEQNISVEEDAFESAKRELLEETGYVSDDWQFLMKVPNYATMADNYAFIFYAKNCKKVSEIHLDDTEYLEPEVYTKEQVRAFIRDGSFAQAIHIMAWFMVCAEYQ